MRQGPIVIVLISLALILLMIINVRFARDASDVTTFRDVRVGSPLNRHQAVESNNKGAPRAQTSGSDPHDARGHEQESNPGPMREQTPGPETDAARGQEDMRAAHNTTHGRANSSDVPRDAEIRSEKDTFASPDEDHLHGVLGVDGDHRLWNPTPLAKPLEEWTAAESRAAHKEYCFNSVLSDSLPLDRERFDSRHRLCTEKKYAVSSMKPSSIIIVFFNEALSPLIRSIHSILNYAPPHLIGEIVLVDDGSILSKRPWLGAPLEHYIRRGLPKTRLSRLPTRSGLMRARMHGAAIAAYENLIFLDSHIECSPGWIEPLVERLSADYRNVALPVIETVHAHDFTKARGGIDILGHSWKLGQAGISRGISESEPNDSPIMAGGLFAITKRWFDDLGQYDPELQEYGGEEMEISFKIWQCGGRMQSVPCSRIGHVFRTGRYWQGQVFSVGPHVITRNKLRAAHVWMDDAAQIVELAFPVLPPGITIGDLSVPKRVRTRLQCHNFDWYLSNVYPELWKPSFEGSRHGALQHMMSAHNPGCVDTLMEASGMPIGVYPCHYQHGSQAFLLTGDGQLRVAIMDFTTCLSVKKTQGNAQGLSVVLGSCDSSVPWAFDIVHQNIGRLKHGDMCVGAKVAPTSKSPFSLTVRKCADVSTNDTSVLWEWV